MFNGMWGVWLVDFDEGACRTYWGDYKDKVSQRQSFIQVLDVIDIGPNRDARRQDRDFVYVPPTRVTYNE